MRIFFVFFVLLLFSTSLYAQVYDDQIVISNRSNSIEQQQKPYVILISIDGFRHDYFEKYQPEFLLKQKAESVTAEYMSPSFPSVTFPNHYTLVTGMIPPHHGLVGNNMLNPTTGERYSLRNTQAIQNPDWYSGIPIWSLAESQNMLTACFYWPGSEAEIAGYYPTYYYPYSENKSVEQRIEKVVEWLEKPAAERPHLITFYMPDVDSAGHRYGPDTSEVQDAVNYIDQALQKLYHAVKKIDLPINFVFVSDHGMTQVDQEQPIQLPKIDEEKVQVVHNGTYASIFVKNATEIDEVYTYFKSHEEREKYRVYLKTQMPKKYKFSDKEDKNKRIGDIVLIAEAPYYISNRKPIPGAHGYLAEDTPDMNTVFMAWGPNIKKGKQIPAFKNIHVYSLLTELLDLEYTHKIDGDDRLSSQVLNKKL